MKLLKKLGLALSAVAFCLSLLVATSYAQPGKAKYEGNRGKHKGWTIGKHKGWNKRTVGWERDRPWTRNGRITDRERTRLQRISDRLRRTEARYRSDGVLSRKEARKLNKRTTKYNRKVTRARRTW